ncbi:MAG: relaxase/mobilization nuclease domain-containing protein [Bacteroidota bacterium]
MVAVIHASSSLKNALQYNEQKLHEGVASLIHAANYAKDKEHLGFTDKLSRLTKQAALNENTKVNSVHISLNFDPSEKLSHEKLCEIADAYMQQIGFGDQPYLVYEHLDAAHPHVHIVTTNIEEDGKRISLHNLGKNQSETARKQIEKDFRLVIAEDHKQSLEIYQQLKPVIVKMNYGHVQTKRAMQSVINHVIKEYSYASLAELNAVLQGYNIVADRGSEDSRVYKSGGLVYRMLNDKKEKVGVPIKASDFFSKPTLKKLEEKFVLSEAKKQQHKQRIKNAIDFALLKKNMPLEDFIKALQKEQIQVVLRKNEAGIIYGITYVDHKGKSVFNGSTLGKQYSAAAIKQRCGDLSQKIKIEPIRQQQKIRPRTIKNSPLKETHRSILQAIEQTKDTWQILFNPVYNNSLPIELLKEAKKKNKKKKQQLTISH